MKIHFQQINRKETQHIKTFCCIKCDYTTTGENVFKQTMESQKPAECPNCNLELVGKITDAK